ncbi:MAG: glucose-1-phosphate thymidylyltransferase [bacterium]
MKGLVLCGGRGTRLRPLTYTMPKQLVPVANRPILAYVFDHLRNAGIVDIGVIVSPETSDGIRRFLGDGRGWNARITYLFQDEPLGLAHGVKISREFLRDEPFVMYLGDNLLQDGIVNALQVFRENDADALIMLKRVTDPRAFGVAVLDEKGKVVRLEEKPKEPPSDLALVGVYIFSPRIHQIIESLQPSTRGELEITDAIQGFINLGARVIPIILDGWWLDTGKKDDLLNANQLVLKACCQRSIQGIVDNSEITGEVSVSFGARIQNSKLFGPAVIGDNTIVDGSTIGPFVSIGANCEIRNSTIRRSVILEKCLIDKVNFLEQSLIGRDVRITSGQDLARPLRLLLSDSSELEL